MNSRYNGLVWKNWGESIKLLTIVGNEFSCYDRKIINTEKRNAPTNSLFPILPYLTEVMIMSDSYKSSQTSNHLIFDSFHSTAVQFITSSQFDKAKDSGLWLHRPEEPELGDDATKGVNQEVVDFIQRIEMDDTIWDDIINGYGASKPNRFLLMTTFILRINVSSFLSY